MFFSHWFLNLQSCLQFLRYLFLISPFFFLSITLYIRCPFIILTSFYLIISHSFFHIFSHCTSPFIPYLHFLLSTYLRLHPLYYLSLHIDLPFSHLQIISISLRPLTPSSLLSHASLARYINSR